MCRTHTTQHELSAIAPNVQWLQLFASLGLGHCSLGDYSTQGAAPCVFVVSRCASESRRFNKLNFRSRFPGAHRQRTAVGFGSPQITGHMGGPGDSTRLQISKCRTPAMEVPS